MSTRFAARPSSTWQLRTRTLSCGPATHLMAILNLTPDSFFDGGLFHSPGHAAETALHLLADGASILDIGGESTRPGAQPTLSDQQEIDRVLPVIELILKTRPDALLSIDTYRAATARAALAAGVEIVNDVSGFLWDPALADVCARFRCGVVLMHTRGRPHQWKALPPLPPEEVLSLVVRDLHDRLAAALAAGIDPARIALDPGFGFGKAGPANYPLLARLADLRAFQSPLVAGLSRKSFLARTLRPLHGGADVPPLARRDASLAALTAAILAGADILRVHDLRPALEAASIADAVLAAS